MNLDELVDWCRARDLHVTIEPPMADITPSCSAFEKIWTGWSIAIISDSRHERFPELDVRILNEEKDVAIQHAVQAVERVLGDDLEWVEQNALGAQGIVDARADTTRRSLSGHAVACTVERCAPNCPIPQPKP